MTLLTSNHIAVLADLHWTAPGTSLAKGQQELPDKDHAPTFWGQVAAAFKDNPLVIFELFNEPFPGGGGAKAKNWETWAGKTPSSKWAGQAQLISAIRKTGAPNVIRECTWLGSVSFCDT